MKNLSLEIIDAKDLEIADLLFIQFFNYWSNGDEKEEDKIFEFAELYGLDVNRILDRLPLIVKLGYLIFRQDGISVDALGETSPLKVYYQVTEKTTSIFTLDKHMIAA